MPRDIRKYLEDILQCIAELEILIADISLETYREVFQIRRAAEREFIIIAEALSRIEHTSSDLHARVADVRRIASFRNVIVHDYLYVDDTYVWNVIHTSIPVLKEQVQAWADELEGS